MSFWKKLWSGSNDQGASIHEEAHDGMLAAVKTLAKCDPHQVFSKNNDGYTPLHMAAAKGHLEIAQFLLASGAEVNARTDRGTTPLHVAVLDGYKNIAELLLANGAEVNAKTDDGMTPLRAALEYHRRELAELLRQHGANE